MGKEKIGRLLGEISSKVEEVRNLLKAPKLKLEPENFRVDATGWREATNSQGIIYLQNPEGDIWEYRGGVSGELVGEQLFTWLAAMRETEKVGKRMPTDEEFNQFRKKDFGRAVYSGYRNTNGSFYDLSTYAYFWLSSVSGVNAGLRLLGSSYSIVLRFRYPFNQANGFSVRCLKN